MIPKREYNPELSLFSNLALDLVDFKDRVRPVAKELALLDSTRKYQKVSAQQIEDERNEFNDIVKTLKSKLDRGQLSEGYSSIEIEDK